MRILKKKVLVQKILIFIYVVSVVERDGESFSPKLTYFKMSCGCLVMCSLVFLSCVLFCFVLFLSSISSAQLTLD